VTAISIMSEADLQNSVIELARLLKWRVAHFRPAMTTRGWRTPVSADGAGFVDLILVRDRLVAAELKSDRGSLADDQVDWQHALVNAGVEYHLWRPQQWVDGTIEATLRTKS
jgi:hypothetical protein